MARAPARALPFTVGLFVFTTGGAPALATPISSTVQVLPSAPSTADNVVLDVDYEFPTTGFSLSFFTVDVPNPMEIVASVVVDAPAPDEPVLFIPTPVSVPIALGMLSAGTHSFTIDLFEVVDPDPFFPIPPGLDPTDTLTGTFVVPEPRLSLLIAMGLAALAVGRRSPGSPC